MKKQPQIEVVNIIRRKVYDPLLRTLHGLMALSILCLFATAYASNYVEPGETRHQLWNWHIKTGYLLVFIFGMRILWGFIGPRFAQLKDFLKYFRNSKLNFESYSFGHDPKAALLYLVLFFDYFILSLTGLALSAIEHNQGPLRLILFDELKFKNDISLIHLFGAWFILGFLILHIGGLSWHQYKNQIPMFQSMITGFQYRRKNERKSKTK